MSATQTLGPMEAIPPFRNEPYADFSVPANRKAMEQALDDVRSQFGREYELFLGGARLKTEEKLISRNPSHPSEVVGIHQKATPALAGMAVESAYSYFPEWSRTSAEDRAGMLLRAA